MAADTYSWNLDHAADILFAAELIEGENNITFYFDNSHDENVKFAYQRFFDVAMRLNHDMATMVTTIGDYGSTQWGREVGYSFRVNAEESNTPNYVEFKYILQSYEKAVVNDEIAGVSAYNDPNALYTGVKNMSFVTSRSQFSLWCMMGSPLILGCDVRSIGQEYIDILTNAQMIGINQDKLVVQAKRVFSEDYEDVLLKPLSDNSVALLFFNKH